MPWLAPTSTVSTSPGLMSCSRMRRNISPMAGCDSEPDGCGLIETPGEANVQGLPSRPTIAPGSKPPPAA